MTSRDVTAGLIALLLTGAAQAADGGAEAEIRFQLSPIRQTTLSSGMAGRIVELSVREGDRFVEGERLVVFDCSLYQAQLNRANAAESGARKKLEVARRLEKLDSISVLEVAQAESAQGVARAEIGVTSAQLRQCVLNAPFAGRVAARKAQRWEHVAEGKELLAIYDDSAFEVELIVPSRWLNWVKPGLNFSVRVDETGADHAAKVTRIGAAVDSLNQTVKVYGRVSGETSGLLPGMSGAATLKPTQR